MMLVSMVSPPVNGYTVSKTVNVPDPVKPILHGSEGGNLFALASNQSVIVYTFSGEVLWELSETSTITAISISPDGTLLAVGTKSKVKVYNLTSKSLSRILYTPSQYVRGISITNDFIAVGSGDYLVVYTLGGDVLWSRNGFGYIYTVVSTNDKIVVGSQYSPHGNLYCYSINGSLIWRKTLSKGNVELLAISSSEKIGAFVDYKNSSGELVGEAYLLDSNGNVITGVKWPEPIYYGHIQFINSSELAVPDYNGFIGVLSPTGINTLYVPSTFGVFYNGSSLVSVASEIYFLNLRDETPNKESPSNWTLRLNITPRSVLVTGRGEVMVGTDYPQSWVYILKDGAVTKRVPTVSTVYALAPAKDGVYVSDDDLVKLDFSGNRLWTVQVPSTITDLDSKGDNVAVVTSRGQISLVTPTGSILWSVYLPESNVYPVVALSNDSIVYTAFTDHYGSWMWAVENGEVLWKVRLPDGSMVRSIASTREGDYIAVGLEDGMVYLLSSNGSIVNQKRIGNNVMDVVLIQRGMRTYLLIRNEEGLEIRTVPDFTELHSIPLGEPPSKPGTSLSASSDGAYIATIDMDGTVRYMEINGVFRQGILLINSNPTGASVYIDGEYKGKTPLNVTLIPGDYILKVTLENYATVTRQITLLPGQNLTITISLTPKFGYLNVYSTPNEAEVYVDGHIVGTTPLAGYIISTGEHTIKLSKEGYEDYTETVFITPGETKEVHAILTEKKGTLQISSTPEGASIYIDGNYMGKTPQTLQVLPGTHTVTIAMQDYQNYTTTITVRAGESERITAILQPVFGYLSVTTEPSGAKVYIDGSYAGETPLNEYKLHTGSHTVSIIKEGYQNYTETVIITSGKTTMLNLNLTKASPTSSSEIAEQTTTTTLPTRTTSNPPTTSPTTTTTYNHAQSSIPTSSSPTTSQSLTPPSNSAPPTSSSKLPYALGALILLMLVGGVATKVRGGKHSPASTPASSSINPHLAGFPSELLSRYEPLEFLGKGGFAKVFKVKRKSDGKIVAVKIPRIDEKTSKTFLREVSTWLQLDHPNIVKLYDADILPVPHLEMEYVEGFKLNGKTIRDLENYPKPADESTALRLVREIAEGLKHAHSKGIYHRDLKPQNVLLKSDLTPKITDWGLAKIGTMSSSRSVMGYTPLYAAPEHLMPSRYGHTDSRTDIFQLGIMFYELLTGRLPFEGYTYEEVFGKITDENYRPKKPSEINPELVKYNGIFEKLLAKKKEDRYQSVDEFLRDLEKLEEAEKRKEELETEVQELKKTLSQSISAMKKSTTAEEIRRNRLMVVDTLGKLALAYAQLNNKAELLNTLNDLKFYTSQNIEDLGRAIETVETLIKENLSIGEDFIERLRVLIHNIKRENGA
ncbi:PEGA domain-containing protein [Thermococcus profundus]|uniref:PEGA domain-containing protein n=1 Tax=Thermococcus profundus TaxID=49899 RepID=UPI0018DF86D8|nr:PEGA domain-containing protein [Thermococcus profundus]